MKIKALKSAFPHTIPVLMGYVFMGTAFGILLSEKGYPFYWCTLMSIIIYAGSMQFVAINILTAVFSPAATLIMTLTVNARHLFYGLSMLGKFKGMGKKKPYMMFALTDETYSLLCLAKPPKGVDGNWFYFFIAVLNQGYWIIGCTLGGVLGSILTFNTKGIDFVMTALFVVILVEQWESQKNHLPAITGVLITVTALVLFGSNHFIVFSMIGILGILTIAKSYLESEKEMINGDSDCGSSIN